MTSGTALQRLLTWLSPAFPVGAFAWSAGLETAIAERRVLDAAALEDWIAGSLDHGGMRTDAIILAHAHRAGSLEHAGTDSPLLAGDDESRSTADAALAELAELALALTPAGERAKETLQTGDAFISAAKVWPSGIFARLPAPCPYPVAVGAIAGAQGISRRDTLLAFLTAAAHSQVSVAVRLVPLGQTDGLKVMAALEGRIAALAEHALSSSLDDIGSIGYAADIAQMRHETLGHRIFRS